MIELKKCCGKEPYMAIVGGGGGREVGRPMKIGCDRCGKSVQGADMAGAFIKWNDPDDDKLFKDTMNKWGVLGQITQAMEECGELIAAISQHFIRKRISEKELASEIADVEIMCKQLRYIIGNELVDKAKEEKIGRLKSRVYGN